MTVGAYHEAAHTMAHATTTQELAFHEIAEIGPLLARGEVSPVELTRACLEQIERLDGQINAFITVLADAAQAEAAQAEAEIRAGNYRGPLHGIPFAHKDLYYTAGIRTTAGSKVLADFVPNENATAVARLNEAGVVLLGKLNMHEFAAGGTNENPHYGPTHNPWSLEHIPGGSSGGSGAALAAGMCLAATGSDTAGSIRIPSFCCGTTGIKPTYGRVSTYGVVPLSWSLDHTGPMARSARDCALLLQAMAGFDELDSASVDRAVPDFSAELHVGMRGLRIGVASSYFNESLHPEVERGWRDALDVLVRLGADAVEVRFPSLGQSVEIGSAILRSECTMFHREWFAARPEDYSDALRDRFGSVSDLTAVEYVAAQRGREAIRADFRAAFSQVDVVVVPVMPYPAVRIGAGLPMDATRFTYPFNLAGLPSLALPCGFSAEGLPLGVQIAAPAWQEALTLRVGHGYQQATDWHKQRPPVQAAT
jgi:aspartyl-tRNA(Asn)/glutamyl-tRNA(Gln) amidotransferase subunit A